MSITDEYITTKEVAQRRGVDVRTVRRWIASKRLPEIKVGGVYVVHITDAQTIRPQRIRASHKI